MMSVRPQTLMQMAGVQPSLPVLDECALLFIDFQCQYLSGVTRLHEVTAALDVAGKLLETCRNASVPVVHVCHQGRPGGMFDPETSAMDIAAQVQANPVVKDGVIPAETVHSVSLAALADRFATVINCDDVE